MSKPSRKWFGTGPVGRYAALLLAYCFLGLGLIGIGVPGLPTVPFLLLAAWFAARGSPRLHRWMYAHPRLGKLLVDWQTQKAISRRSKAIAVLMLLVSGLVMYWRLDNIPLLAALLVLFLVVAAYLVSRPEPR